MLTVTLSRRNLLSLLHKLEFPNSKRTIIKDAGVEIAVVAITDEECYADRDPGPMHPDTEQFVAEVGEALDLIRQWRAS